MKLIKNWREAWKMHTVQIFAMLIAAPLVWDTLPMDWKASIPPEWLKWITLVCGIIGIYARVRPQPSIKKEDINDPRPD